MRRDLLDLASDLARRGQPFALATVVARTPPISAHVGDTALVTGDGEFHGWVGGSCTRPTVIAEALEALRDSRPRLVALDPNPESRRRPGLTVFPMTCHSGGSVEIHIQPVLPPPRLVVYGLSPTARALARVGKALGYTVEVVDPEADPADFPGIDRVVKDAKAVAPPAPSVPLYAVVATQGQWDEDATAAAAALAPAYLGVMASPKRFGEMRAMLGEKAPAGIKNPAGLNLGAELPEDIAISIFAEIVQLRAAVATKAPQPQPAASAVATDPICGMSVKIEGAKHRATRDGREYYFCCAGCRERFLAGAGA